MRAMYMGLSRSSVVMEKMVMPPRKSPVPPRPAIALPIMKAFIDGAAPHIAEPTSKRKTERMNVHFTLNVRKNWPNGRIVAVPVRV